MNGRDRERPDDCRARPRNRMRSITPLLLAFSILAHSGCIITGPHQWLQNGLKVGPEYNTPPAPVAAEWIQANDPLVQSSRLEQGDWWNVFDDPTLTALIDLAYENNPNLRTVGARVLEARAGQAISVGNLLPQSQQAIGSYSRVNLNPNMPVIDQLVKSLPPGSAPLAFSNWLYGFNLSWELDLWGRIRRNIESANANLDASVEDYDSALVTLFADIASNYVQYRVAQQRIKIARDNVRIQEGVLALAEQRFRVGTTTNLDVQQARTVLEQTRSTIPGLQILLGQANDTLCILVGVPPRDLEADLGPGPATWQLPDPEYTRLGRCRHPGRPLAAAARCSRRRAPGGGSIRADRCRRGRPLPDDLHQRNPGMGRRELLASILYEKLPGPSHARLPVEHPELRPNFE